MTFAISPTAWPPQRRGIEQTQDALLRGKRVCLYSPTGGGKTFQAMELFRWVASSGAGGCFYINRRLLIPQVAERMTATGLNFGIRAAGYEDQYRFDAPFQICSIDTERSRVLSKDRKVWDFHDVGHGGLVVVDEAHIQKSESMWQVLEYYRSVGAMIVLLTATPVGLSEWADELVVSGRLQEYRDCKALVPAIVKSPDQPDLRKIERSVTGEFILDGEKRRIFTQAIVGSVIGRWKEFNPHARPAMLYAPGKPESIWLTEQFEKEGVPWCHVDATDAVLDGRQRQLTRSLWDEIIGRYKDGKIKGLSSRFKLREGIDVPGTYQCILATPIGSLASYIQTVGRVLRYSPATPDSVLVTDHGGNYHRHGSPNHDRDWKAWWTLPEHAVSEMHTNSIRDKKTPEPICCPKCFGERTGGRKCPHCGFEHEKSKRHVIQHDGKMVEHDGHMVKPRRVKLEPDTAELWKKMFFGYRNKKVDQSFEQLAGFFAHTHGYHPPRTLNLMPTSPADWYRKVHEVPMQNLTGWESRKESAT